MSARGVVELILMTPVIILGFVFCCIGLPFMAVGLWLLWRIELYERI